MKAAYKKAALIDAVSSQSGKVAVLTDSQLGQMGSAMLDSRHTRSQETDADTYSYDFMKKYGYNVNAVESSFNILANMSSGAEADFLSKMMASHPDSRDRAANAKSRAEADGLYKPYVKQTAKTATKTTKKVTKKKK